MTLPIAAWISACAEMTVQMVRRESALLLTGITDLGRIKLYGGALLPALPTLRSGGDHESSLCARARRSR